MLETTAAVIFSLWFLACLTLAIRAIRGDDMVHHRRWMIRAFAVGVAVGTIRIWQAIRLRAGGTIDRFINATLAVPTPTDLCECLACDGATLGWAQTGGTQAFGFGAGFLGLRPEPAAC
jgi:hypothetical protein